MFTTGTEKKGNPSTQLDDMTEIGYKDCRLVSKLMSSDKVRSKIKKIYTSPFFRCKKTAEIINQPLQVEIIEDERLNEFGSFSGESWLDAQNRIISCIDDIIERYDDEDYILCVTSGANISAFICKAFSIKPSNDVPMLGVPNCSPVVFEFKK